MEKDITIGFIFILFGILFGFWTYKNPVSDPKTDMLNTGFKGYLWSIFSIILGLTIIIRCISAGHGLI